MEQDLDEEFCLKWNNHHQTFMSVLHNLLKREVLVDVTLAAEGHFIEVHRLVLCACSDYFQNALNTQHHNKQAYIFLNNVSFLNLKALVDYMYKGEVNVSQEQLPKFLAAAEALQIKGLSEKGDKSADNGLNQQTKLNKNKTLTSNHLVNNPHQVDSSSSRAVASALPSSQPLLKSNVKISVLSSEMNRVSPISLTDSLNVIAEDNFIEVNDERNSDHLEQGIGKLGQAWSIKPDSEGVDWVNNGIATDSDRQECYIPHAESDNSVEYHQYTSTNLHTNVDAIHGAQEMEEEAGSFFPDPSSIDAQPGHSEWNTSGANSSNHSRERSRGSTEMDEKKKMSCPNCGRHYSQKGSLNRHIKFECGITPKFPCPICPLRFRRAYKLTEHLNKVHQQEPSLVDDSSGLT